MNEIILNGKTYMTDEQGFLTTPEQWDENYVVFLAPELEITEGLSPPHWQVIHFIRDRFQSTGQCPLVYEACRHIGATSGIMKKLFPSGYLRGACRLAGITYANRRVNYYGEAMIPRQKTAKNGSFPLKKNKIYSTDIHGFLIDHRQWDEDFAAHRMADMKVTGGITKKHWEIIHYLRNTFEKKNIVPTFFTCCEENDISIEALENLFPIGYHRGAIKAAGLRVRNMELN